MTLHVYSLAFVIYGDIAPVTALCTRPKTLKLRFNVMYYTAARTGNFGKLEHAFEFFREQAWRIGESTRRPTMWSEFEYWRRRHYTG